MRRIGQPDYAPIPDRRTDLLTPVIVDHSIELAIDADIAAHAAITDAHHDPITVVDSATIDFTLTGQQITADFIGTTDTLLDGGDSTDGDGFALIFDLGASI